MAPVMGTMLDGRAYTGRPASSANAKRGVSLKLRSIKLDWRVLYEYVPSMVVLMRLRSIGPLHCRLERRLRGAAYPPSNNDTLGTALEKTVPLVPSAQVEGTRDGSVKAAQSAIGVAGPTQISCCTAPGRPVLSIAPPMSVACGVFWKTPMPPRTTARGPRNAPSKAPICAAVP